MHRNVIADSDEEDDDAVIDESAPRRRQTQPPISNDAAAVPSLGGNSPATASTDPAFIQGILNEQNEAARESMRDVGLYLVAERDKLSSSEVTAPANFKRTWKGFDQSKTPSLLEPTQAPEYEIRPSEPLNGQARIRASRARKGSAQDPYDIPSSPELQQGRGRRGFQSPETDSDNQKAQSRLRRGGGTAADDELAADLAERLSERTKKRRRTDKRSEQVQAFSVEDGFYTTSLHHDMKGRHDIHEGRSSGDASRQFLPVSGTLPFVVAPKRSADCQKCQDQNSDANSYHQGSSDAATNVNTPRGHDPLSMGHSIDEGLKQARTEPWIKRKASSSFRRVPNSSPDEISGMETCRRQGQARPVSSERDLGGENHIQRMEKADDECDLSYETQQKREKQKRPRGRPKKSYLTATRTAIPKSGMESDQPESNKGVRPKNQKVAPESNGQNVILDEAEAEGILEKADDDDKDQSDQAPSVGVPLPKKGGDGGHHNLKADNGDARSSLKIEAVKGHDDQGELTSKIYQPAAVISQNNGGRTKTELLSSRSNTQPRQPKLLTDVAAAKTPTEKPPEQLEWKMGSLAARNTAKPLYRVGLSKRSRIAPLLKSLPK